MAADRRKPFRLRDGPADAARIDGLVSQMSIEQKIGQMCTFEFCGTRITPDVVAAVREHHCGGLRVTPHIYTALPYGVRHRTDGMDVQRLSPYAGPDEYAELLNELQRLALARPLSIPLHISSDQEGDWSQDYSRGGVNLFPSQMGMAATGDPELVYEAYRAVARQQRAVGIMMLHTPVLDVNTNPDNPEIGTRSFSDDPETVVEYGLALMRAFRDEGVVATGKHFPGRGESSVDVHFSLDTHRGDRRRLDEVELYPYRALIAEGLPAVMVAHTIYPALDGTNTPASVSRAIVTDLLRGELGFEGVITSDAMGMRGVIEMFDGFGEACAAALAAGNDLVLAKGDPTLQPEVIAAALRYLDEGKLGEAQVDASVRRVLAMKMRYGLFEQPEADPAGALDAVRDRETVEISRRAAVACMSVVRDEDDLLPVARDARVFVTDQHNWPYHNKAADYSYHSHQLPEFLRARAADPLLVDDWETGLQVSADDERECLERAARADVVVVLSSYWRSSGTNTELLRKLIATGRPVITISNCPYEWISIPEAQTLILSWSCMPRSLEAAAEVIYGDLDPGPAAWPLRDYALPGAGGGCP